MPRLTQQFIAVSASIAALLVCAYSISLPTPTTSRQSPVFVRRLGGGNLVLQGDPRERLRRDSPYSAALIRELYPFGKLEAAYWSRLQSGVTDFRSGNSERALTTWRAIVTATPESDLALSALCNIGQVQHHSGRLADAIVSYNQALATRVQSPLKHYIAIDLSQAHLQLQQFSEAVRVAHLAKTQYPPDSFCGLWYDCEQQLISEYIATVQVALSQQRPAHLQNQAEWDALNNVSVKD